MIISAIVSDGTPAVINAEELDELLKKNAILAFHRRDGWARVGFDEIRDQNGVRESSWKERKSLVRQRQVANSNSLLRS
ncbi:MAG: hypothetical protein A2X80_11460 [Geobacteraceae bacterium GWB2_52_12]|nr:MAG: hypothetical protein A2X80_11460 [Geobacteraceae bacterium GWB2_52_12]